MGGTETLGELVGFRSLNFLANMHLNLYAISILVSVTYATPYPQAQHGRLVVSNITCPPTAIPMPGASSFPPVKTMPDPFLYLDGQTRVQSKDEWAQCRRPEILRLLHEYQYGYYPDHTQEAVSATRSGNSLAVTVVAGGRSASISATLNLPTGNGPFPVIISIGGMDMKTYLNAGIAVVTFDYSRVAADSNSKSGAFWTLYNGRDIGESPQVL
jgi:hypothetical protein